MSPSAFWTPAEETSLVDFLVECKAEAGDGANFKKATFQRAANHIAPLLERGAAKSVKSCQNKWTSFRKIYRVIRAIQAVSGWVWDDETGASITPHSASSWDDYVKKHPEAKPFRNRGWCHLAKVSSLMPSTATGANVYHPTATMDEDPASLAAVSSPNYTQTFDDEPLDHEDSEDDQAPPPAPASRKRAREPATPTSVTAKRPRASHGATALQDMSTSLAQVGNALAAALAPPANAMDPTPRRRADAVSAALRLEKDWLNNQELVALIDFIRADQTATDIYTALTEPDVRREWVRTQLKRLGILVL